jgi:hypothetical protein
VSGPQVWSSRMMKSESRFISLDVTPKHVTKIESKNCLLFKSYDALTYLHIVLCERRRLPSPTAHDFDLNSCILGAVFASLIVALTGKESHCWTEHRQIQPHLPWAGSELLLIWTLRRLYSHWTYYKRFLQSPQAKVWAIYCWASFAVMTPPFGCDRR